MKLPVAALLLTACAGPRTLDGAVHAAPEASAQPIQVPGAGSNQVVEANWKERLAQPYVYLEHRGDYRQLGDAMRALFQQSQELGITSTGAPFALFYDDPGQVAVESLRARVCLPVAERPARLSGLEYDVLPRSMVAYARVPGAYPEVARSYPALFAYLRELGWRPATPIREVYLVNPVDVPSYDQLVTEVQIPWSAPGR